MGASETVDEHFGNSLWCRSGGVGGEGRRSGKDVGSMSGRRGRDGGGAGS